MLKIDQVDLPANSAAKNEKDIHIVAISRCFLEIFILVFRGSLS